MGASLPGGLPCQPWVAEAVKKHMASSARPAMTRGIASPLVLLMAAVVATQAQEHHLAPVSGVPHGIPPLCAAPSTRSTRDGDWSNPSTWSGGRVPAPRDSVLVARGTSIVYDTVSDGAVDCVDVQGSLRFRTDASTRLTVVTLIVSTVGRLEIGTAGAPVSGAVSAEIVIADRPLDTARDPEQFGHGIVGLGIIRVHGAVRTPPFIRLAAEPRAGQTRLVLDERPAGWRAGDRLVLPDTRHLGGDERGSRYQPQWEELTVAAVSGQTVTLAAPLAFDHKGARRPDGVLEFLPHVGNVTRNVVIRSANPRGVRGHVLFVNRADVDIRYARFADLGRTRPGVLDNTEIAADGGVRHIGTNLIGRYALHLHHLFGPSRPAANGSQFALIGNAIDGAAKWGLTIHNSHFGLVRDNVVYDARGAGIVAEDGSETMNVLEHNFVMRSEGSGDSAPRSGYGGAANDPGGEGSGFWLRGPNNVLRNNVAANVEVFGFDVAAGALGTVRAPLSPGADTSEEGGYRALDTTVAALPEFSGNEAYGAVQTGVAIGWNGTLTNTRVWHATRQAIAAYPVDELTIDGAVVRGDVAVLARDYENPAGIWLTNYAAKHVVIRRADVQGLRVGVFSPFSLTAETEPGRGDGTVTVEDSYFRAYVGVAIGTAYARPGRAPSKKAFVRGSRFDPLAAAVGRYPPAAISMNYGMAAGDAQPREPIRVIDFNARPGDTFRLFYSLGVSEAPAPCRTSRPGLSGFACSGDESLVR